MLTLTRKQSQEIIIETPGGEIITIAIKEVRRNQVRIGIKAPREMQINRGEVHEAIQQAKDAEPRTPKRIVIE